MQDYEAFLAYCDSIFWNKSLSLLFLYRQKIKKRSKTWLSMIPLTYEPWWFHVQRDYDETKSLSFFCYPFPITELDRAIDQDQIDAFNHNYQVSLDLVKRAEIMIKLLECPPHRSNPAYLSQMATMLLERITDQDTYSQLNEARSKFTSKHGLL